MIIDATYSAEDNKLRLYCSERLDSDLYSRVKEAGFKWAPKQDLFVAPRWTPAREDLCLELAGDISAEQSTLAERAEAKAERLDNLAHKRAEQANGYWQAAERISQRFAAGQPILIGHHSERKAHKDQEKMHRASEKAADAFKAVDYWGYRAEGVERYANMKVNPRVRANRIKKLLKELRDWQRNINHAFICVQLWSKIQNMADGDAFNKAVEYYAGAQLDTGGACYFDAWSDLRDGKRQHRELVDSLVTGWKAATQKVYTFRWISHILNRLAFEQSEQGPVSVYTGALNATLLQAFAREHGAHKPKATPSDSGHWVLNSRVPLPAHIGDGTELSLDTTQWCQLMQSVGYAVPEPTARRKSSSTKTAVPLINPTLDEATRLQTQWNQQAAERHQKRHVGSMEFNEPREITQALYSANAKGSYSPFSTISLDGNGDKIYHPHRSESKTAVCRVRVFNGSASLYAPQAILVLTDKTHKPLPIEWPDTVVESV